MQSRAIHIGQRYEIEVKGTTFPATVVRKIEGRNGRTVAIVPDRPERYTQRHVSPRMVRRRLESA